MKQDCSNSSVSPKTLSGEAQLAADEIVAITSSSPSHQLRIMQVLNVKYENEWNSSIPGAFCSYCSLGFHVVVFSCFFFCKDLQTVGRRSVIRTSRPALSSWTTDLVLPMLKSLRSPVRWEIQKIFTNPTLGWSAKRFYAPPTYT